MKKVLFTLGLVTILSQSFSQVITPFTVRKSITQKGGIIYLSNTSSKAVPDNVVQNEIPPAGTGYDNNFTNGYVDIDGDPSTFMSSSDQLNLPTCSEISWAGLYWGADCSTGDENFATRNQVKLKVNSGTYINLTADYLKDNTVGYRTYHCFKDITSILQANGLTDRYTVANVANDIGGTNLFGGWTIVVIYKNNTLTMRNLTVFDGLANVSAGTYSTVDIPISGFQTPLSGPVNFELGLVVYDGDRSLTGDQLLFKGGTSFVNLSDAIHPSTDMFNSTLARNGALTTLRNPNYNNTLGYDANIFAPNNSTKNYIGNNAISATIRQTTGGETFLTQVVTSAIDVYEPDLRSAVRVKNLTHPVAATAQPGDTLEYTINGLNIGSDPAIKAYITDTIEGNAQYVPGSIKITYGPNSGVMTDAAGDDQAEYISSSKVVKVRIGTGANNYIGGLINNSPTGTDSTQFKFKVLITTDCVYLNCDNNVDNSAHIIGTGNISGNTYDNASNPGVFNSFGCPISGTTKTPVSISGCPVVGISANSPICQGGSIYFTATASPYVTYSWAGPNGFTSSIQSPTVSNVSNLSAGIYTANIDVTGRTCRFTYTLNADINIANAGSDQTGLSTCGLTTVTLAANNPVGTSGVWSIVSGTGGGFGVSNTSTTSIANSTFNGIAGNTYTLRWSLTSVGCPASTDDVTITFNKAPIAVLTGTSITCASHLNVAITGGISPYTLSINNGVGTVSNYVSGNDIFVYPSATTQYSLMSVVGSNGCSASSITGNPTTITVSNSMGTGTIVATNPPSGTFSSTPTKYPTTSSIASGNGSWTNASNAYLNDNTYATVTNSSTGNTQYLYLNGFGFSVPAGATIDGIVVNLKKHATGTVTDSRVTLVANTSSIGSNKTLTGSWPTSDAVFTYGSSTDMWGSNTTGLTPTVVNNSNFGIRIRANIGSSNAIGYVDYAAMTVYYHTGTTSYCDNNANVTFSVTGFSNATGYTWTAPTGGSVISGQGTNSVTIDLNGAGQSGNYAVIVTPSNSCGSGTPASLTVPISDCANTTPYCIMGNIYWDYNGNNKVDGTPISTAKTSQLYVSAAKTSGTTSCFATVPVNADGSWRICNASVASSTSIKVVLSTNNYSVGTSSSSMLATLPSGCSNMGEINNDLGNTLTGNDGSANGVLTFTTVGSMTNNETNLNFGIKIATAPVANNDASTTNEDTPVTFNITNNDTDIDGTVTVSSATLSTNSSNGTWSVSSTGNVTYTPSLNFNGTASITYTIKDNDLLISNSGTITVTVNPVNDPPVATTSSVTTLENTTYSFVASDFKYTDVESNLMTSITIASLPALGSLKYNGVAVSVGQVITVANIPNLSYTPLYNQYGASYTTFTFKVNDLDAGTVAGVMTVHVTKVNVAPVAVNDAVTTNQNTPVSFNILTNDINVDGTLLTNSVDLDPLTAAQQNSISIPGEGTYTCNSSGVVTFTPLSSFYGNATPILYTVNNSLSLTSNQANIIVTVIPFGAPVANSDSSTTTINNPVIFSLTNNDTGINTINPSRVDLDPNTPGIQQSLYVINQGQFSVDVSGNLTFMPDWNFSGTVTAQYTVKDNLNLVSNTARIKVVVSWANTPPIAVDDINSTNEDTPITFNVTTNDYDLDITHGNAGIVDNASVDLNPLLLGTQTSYTMSGQGTFTVNNTGNVTFIPALNFNGFVTPLAYTVKDKSGALSDSALIIINVIPVNDAPVAVNDVATTAGTSSTASFTFNITSNDTDVDGTVDISSVDLDPYTPGIQTVFTVAGEGTYSVDNSGNITFSYSFVTPIDTLTPIHYSVKDNSGLVSNNGLITVIVLTPGIPLAVDDAITTNEDTPVSYDISVNDIDNDGLNPGIDGGTLTLIGSLTSAAGTWSVTDAANFPGYVTFIPALNYYGTASITYTIADLDGNPSNPAIITVTINPVNDVPSFSKGANNTVCQNSGVQIFNGWATSLSAGPLNESSQSLSFNVNNNNNLLFSTQPAIDASGNLSYIVANNQNGVASVSVSIQDDGGTLNGGIDTSPIQIFTITVMSAPSITATASSVCSGSIASLTGSGAVSYTWNPGSLTGATATVIPVSTTIYTLSGANAQGCINTKTVNLIVNAQPSVSLSATSTSLCSNSTVTLTASGGNTYLWNTGATTSSIVVTPTVTTNYTVTGTSAQGCSATQTIGLTVGTLPTVGLSASSNSLCSGSTVTLTASGGNTYLWNTSATTSVIAVSPTVTTNYTVTGTNAQGCSATQTVALTVNSVPTLSLSASSNSLCSGSTVTLTASGGNTYLWNTGTTTSVIAVSPTVTTNYTVTGTSAQGCANTKTVSLTVNSVPTLSLSTSSNSLCSGSTVTLTASGGNTYLWNTSATTSVIAVSPTITTNYTVTGTNAQGCSATQTVALTVNSVPTLSLSASSNSLCVGSTVTLTASGGNTYLWNTSATTSVIAVSPTVTTNYTVTGTSAQGCANTKTVSLTVNSVPTLSLSTSSNSLCSGSTVTLTASGGNTYLWNTSATTSVIAVSPTITTNYTVTGTNAQGCSATQTVALTVNSLPSLTLSATSSTLCNNGVTTLSVLGASSYVWNPGSLSGSSITRTVTSTVVYSVTGTTTAGCSSSASISIVLNNCPTAVNDATNTIQGVSVISNAGNNDSGITGATFTTGQPTVGSGTLTMNPTTGQYTYTPNSSFTGTTSATYTICNGSPVVCSTAVITITVFPTLVANPDIIATTPSVATTGTLLTNDGGIVSGGNYSVSITPPSSSTGTITVNSSTGGYTFTPNPSFTGSVTTTYTVCNNSVNPTVCSSSTITIVVGNSPVAVSDATTTVENTPVFGNASSNDSGVLPSLNPVFTSGAASTGTLVMNSSTGQYTYTPASGFTGTATATYTLCNVSSPPCSTTTIVFTIYPSLVANLDVINATPSSSVTGNLTTNDLGVVPNATYSVSVTQLSTSTGTITVNPATGGYTFTPNSTFTGTTSTTYTICNTSVNPIVCSTATITINVFPNPAPVNDAITTIENTPVSANASTNDGGVTGGTYSIGSVTIGTGTITMNSSTGQYTFTPSAGFTGTTSATYTLCNGAPVTCSTAVITVTVYPVLVANPDAINTTPSAIVSGTLTINDLGVVPNATYSVSVTQLSTSTGTITVNPSTGDYTFTPNSTYTGSTTTTYTISNISVNPIVSSSTTITIIVGNLPIAVLDSNSTIENTSVMGDLSSNDSGVSSSLNPIYTAGSLSVGTGTLLVNSSTGQYTYTPASGFTGTTSSTYTLCNVSSPPCSTASITFTVYPALVANPDAITTVPSATVTGNLTTNDLGVVPNASYSVSVTQPSSSTGTITVDPATGGYTFTPNASYTGTTTTTYTICNTSVNPVVCSTSTITINVQTVLVGYPQIAVAKSVLSTTKINTTTFQSVFKFNVSNIGSLAGDNVQLVDNLNTTFPLPITYTVVGVNANLPLTVNSLYNGNTSVALLSGTNTLNSNQSSIVTLTVNFNPNNTTLTTLSNYGIGSTSALPDPDGNGVHTSVDTTNTGNNSDPDGDGNPNEPGENNPTLFGPQIGAAKTASALIKLNTTSYQTVFTFNVANVGPVVATNVQLVDNLANVFPSPITYTVAGLNSTAPLTVNSSYNGSSNLALLSGTNSLNVSQNSLVTLTVNFSMNGSTIPVLGNLGIASTSAFPDIDGNGVHTSVDTTNAGENPDPDGDGNPNEPGENNPTLFGQQIGVAKTALSTVLLNNGVNQTVFEFKIKNLGVVIATNIQLIDNLNNTFPAPITYTVNSVSASSGLTPNTNYNGGTITTMLSGNNTLGLGVVETVTMVVSYNMHESSLTQLFNSGVALSSLPNGVVLSVDTTNTGDNTDVNDNGNPNEPGDNLPTGFTPVKDTTDIVFSIPEGFSPNGDGVNDVFVIKGITLYPKNTFTVLNRWGNIVSKIEGYNNNDKVWNGKASEGVRYGGDELPEGTYFYILDLGNGDKPYKGFIYLNKTVN